MNLFEKQELAEKKSQQLEHSTPEKVLQWAINQFRKITFACSFGAEDVVLVDMIHRIKPTIDIFYLDTNFHFKETYETRDRLTKRYGIHFIQVLPELTPDQQATKYGDKLWRQNPDLCCNIRKVQPLAKTLSRYDAWITGIRREQSPTRANAKKVEYDIHFALIKINPLADWSSKDVWDYIRKYKVIYNPLHDQNYPSIGCTYCTRPIKPGEDPRAGRWSGSTKTECGIHVNNDRRK